MNNKFADGLSILIIEDNQTYGYGGPYWERMIKHAGGKPIWIKGPSKKDFKQQIDGLLQQDDIQFHGTILDIMFQNSEKTGGIELWMNMLSAEDRAKLGLVLVTTRDDNTTVTDFVSNYANGRLSYNEKKEMRETIFIDFCHDIYRAQGFPIASEDLAARFEKFESRITNLEKEVTELKSSRQL